jgi:hypothetical protein
MTAVLAGASIVAMTALTLSWTSPAVSSYPQTIWGNIARVFSGGANSLFSHDVLTRNALEWAGMGRTGGAALVFAAALAAYALALSTRTTRASRGSARPADIG